MLLGCRPLAIIDEIRYWVNIRKVIKIIERTDSVYAVKRIILFSLNIIGGWLPMLSG